MQNSLDNLQKAVNEACSAYNLYKRKISDLENKLRHNDDVSLDRCRFKIVKKIFYYMMGGIKEYYAITLAFVYFQLLKFVKTFFLVIYRP